MSQKCGVPLCIALADLEHPANRRPRRFFGPFCVVHLEMPSSELAEAMSRKAGLVEPLECVTAGTVEYETSDGRRYMLNRDGSRRYTR